jgi:prepilin-type N-terminal cleavage/methylation domain-containing protein
MAGERLLLQSFHDMTGTPARMSVARCGRTGGSLVARAQTGTARSAGFTLVEMLLVVAIIATLAGMAVPIAKGMITQSKADSAGLEVLGWLEEARNRATAERRNFEVTFDTGTNHVRVDRVEADLSTTLILDNQLPEGVTFRLFAGMPDTPDLFGKASAVDFDGPAPHMFTSDGSLLDANGDPSNGTLFFGKANHAETARAITVFGMTGLLRSWKAAGNGWTQ